jgi:murein DD-endopeptidase MepM/ murein hydrolase activator NlpD
VPAADHPRTTTVHTRPSRTARAVLLAALAAGLVGLALPAGHPARLAAVTSTVTSTVAEPREPNPARLLVPATAARPTAARASRSRSVLPVWVRPVAAGIVSPYGRRWGRMHPGVDFGAHYGAPIHAVGAGVVIGAGYLADEGGYGQIVLVRHAGGVVTAYAHMSRVLAHAGERVEAGETIGLVGATGHVTGPHLHFEVRIGGAKINPVPWLRAHGVRV